MNKNIFNNTKIYKIIDTKDKFFYIGSTTHLLSVRLKSHINKSRIDRNRPFYKYFLKVGWENAKIILIEEHHFENRYQQLKEEDNMIQLYKNDPLCLNSCRPFTGMTRQEYNKKYYDENKDKIIANSKEYYTNNIDNVLQYHKEYYILNKKAIDDKCKARYDKQSDNYKTRSKEWYNNHKEDILKQIKCDCGGKYILMGKHRHEKKRKHLNYINDIQENIVGKICECGGTFTYKHKARHEKSRKHITWLNDQKQESETI